MGNPGSYVTIGPGSENGMSSLILKGDISATIRARNLSDLDKPTHSNSHQYATLRDHELHHVQIYGENWNRFVAYANPFEKDWTCNCAKWAQAVLEAQLVVTEAKANLDNIQFDIDEYGDVPAAMVDIRVDKIEAQKQLQNAQNQLRDFEHKAPLSCEIP